MSSFNVVRNWIIVVLLLGWVSFFVGCEDSEGEAGVNSGNSNGNGKDPDTSSDTDTDGDSDWDTDFNPNKDGGSSTPGCGFDGVDLLVVVDNSASMDEEQKILATGFFTLINSLIHPVEDPNWGLPAADNVRVAVVSSDLGLQYGDSGSTSGYPYGTPVQSCNDVSREPKGDNGRFMASVPGGIDVSSEVISCDPDGVQCPLDWTCNESRKCVPANQGGTVSCSQPQGGDTWVETTYDLKNPTLALQIACMGQLGTSGCGVEQQLEASVKALSRNDQKSFIRENHLLAVLVVSDEEDCSVESSDLFQTAEWKSGSGNNLNTACNLPAANEQHLFDTSRYYEKLIELKGGHKEAVVFAAIVGVPYEGTGGDACQGTGAEISECLAQAEMQLAIKEFQQNGIGFKHFATACTRNEGEIEVTGARPGRRYVQVAENYGSNGYIYSICNQDWSPAMREIARLIAESICVF